MTLLIWGAGANGRVVLDLASEIKSWDNIIFVDRGESVGQSIENIPVISVEQAHEEAGNTNCEVLISVGDAKLRSLLFEECRGFNFATLIHPMAIVSPTAIISSGSIVSPFVFVGNNAVIGENCLISSHTMVGHDTVIGDHSSLSHMCGIGGGCRLETQVYIGMSAIIRQQLTLGKRSVIGMGAVVVKNVDSDTTVVGNPAKILTDL